jgi:hypothetical protein
MHTRTRPRARIFKRSPKPRAASRPTRPSPPPPPKGGVDVVFDPVGGKLLAEALKVVAWGAQYLVIGFVAGIPKVPANLLLVKNCTVGGWGATRVRVCVCVYVQVCLCVRVCF